MNLNQQLITLSAVAARLRATSPDSAVTTFIDTMVGDLLDPLSYRGSWDYEGPLRGGLASLRADWPGLLSDSGQPLSASDDANTLATLASLASDNATSFATLQFALNQYEAKLPSSANDVLTALGLNSLPAAPTLGSDVQTYISAVLTWLQACLAQISGPTAAQQAAVQDFGLLLGTLDSIRLMAASLNQLWSQTAADAATARNNVLKSPVDPLISGLSLGTLEGDWDSIQSILGPGITIDTAPDFPTGAGTLSGRLWGVSDPGTLQLFVYRSALDNGVYTLNLGPSVQPASDGSWSIDLDAIAGYGGDGIVAATAPPPAGPLAALPRLGSAILTRAGGGTSFP